MLMSHCVESFCIHVSVHILTGGELGGVGGSSQECRNIKDKAVYTLSPILGLLP